MANIRCVNRKTYALTVGREYEQQPVPQNDNYYTIINDNGLRARYASNLFEAVEEVVIPDTPEIIRQNMVITATTAAGGVASISIKLSITIDGEEAHFEHTLARGRALNSCGIIELEGIEGLMDLIRMKVPDRGTLRTFAITQIVDKILEYTVQYRRAFLTFSTNDRHELYPVLNEVLTEKASHAIEGVNLYYPTNITLWIITLNHRED